MNVAQVGNSTVITAVGASDGLVLFYWGAPVSRISAPEVVTPPPTVAFRSSSVAQVGNASVIAAVGSDGSLWFYWQTIGTKPWNAELVAAPNEASPNISPPIIAASIAQVGNASVIAAVGSDGSLWFYWQTIGTAPWNPESVAAPTNSPNISPPFIGASIAQGGNASVIAAVGSDGSLWFYWQTIGAKPWNPELVAAAASASSPVTSASITRVSNSVVIAAVRQDGTLSFYYQTIGAAPIWSEEPVPVPGPNSVSSASVAQVGNSSVIAAVREGGSLWFYWQTIGGGIWSPEQVPIPNTVFSSASVAQVGDFSAIAAAGSDGSLWAAWQTIGGEGWGYEPVAQPGSVVV